MLIDDLVLFSHNEWQSHRCARCNGKTMCDQNCKDCLDDLHFHYNRKRDDYYCERLLDYYVCRYSYKYCSEIMYALEDLDFSQYPYLHILSLGCGGAADLLAFESLPFSQPISYIGVDKNPFWEKIHSELQEQCSFAKVQFIRDVDVLNDLTDYNISETNIIIIEYLISFFYRTIGEQGVKKWFNDLVKYIFTKKSSDSPLMIIINDVDSINTGRDSFQFLKPIAEQNGFNLSFERRMRFNENSYFQPSELYYSKQNKFDIPDFVKENYAPAINCGSVQLILEVI